MRREARAVGALVLALAWFARPAERLAGALRDAHGREIRFLRLPDLASGVIAVATLRPRALPSGDEARRCARLLDEVAALQETQESWVHAAVGALDPEQVDAVVRAPRAAALPRSHLHPTIPPDLLRIADLIARTHGSVPADRVPVPGPATRSIPAATLTAGLRALVEAGEPPLRPDQAAAVLAAILEGMQAHARSPGLLVEAEDCLGPQVAAAAEGALGAEAGSVEEAVRVLR